MTQTLPTTKQSGFTLVELAIVLMIIGLLIGGILRGQELMENARVTSTIQQTKAYDGATTTFRDQYSALPGDISNADARLPNCAAGTRCGTAGNGDGVVGALAAGFAVNVGANLNDENSIFWNHLATARLISGVQAAGNGAVATWGDQYPVAKIAGGFHVVSMNVPAAPPINAVSGLHLALGNIPGAGSISGGADGTNAISPVRAQQFDSKLDDGVPNTGDVIGVGGTGCVNGAYVATIETKNCNLLIRLQS